MALQKCHECSVQVSDTAKACPQCGAKIKKPTSRWVIGVAGLIIIFTAKAVLDPDPTIEKPAAPAKTAEQIAAGAKKEAEFQKVVAGAYILKQGMKNPVSFKLESATMMADGSICYEYRSTNSFNAVVPGRYVMAPKNSGDSAASWNKYCGGKSGTDYTSARQAL